MERFTISLDEDLARAFDDLIARHGYSNRSEAVRDLLRRQLESDHLEQDDAEYCIANLSYVYNHHRRTLAERLVQIQHDHHDLVVSTLHAHLDHENCLESAILRGPTTAVRRFADAMMAESGVRHSQLNLISLDVDDHGHDHGYSADAEGHHSHQHVHLRPKS